MSAGERDVVQRAYAALAEGNLLDVLGGLDDQIQWHEPVGYGPPLGGTHHGPTAVVRDVFDELAARWPGYRLVPAEFLEVGDQVVVLGRAHLPEAGGDGVASAFAHVWRVRDGRVTEVRVFTDTAAAMGTATARR